MRKKLSLFLTAMVSSIAVGCSQPSQDAAASDEAREVVHSQSPEFIELAAFPSGVFLENLTLTPENEVLLTSYFDKKILKLDDADQSTTFATLETHPVGIITTVDGYIVSAHGKPFTDQPAFTETNLIFVLDRSGEVVREIAVPDGLFLNGIYQLDPDTILAADSLAGTVWAISMASGETSPWLQGEELSIDPTVSPFRPAANGLKSYEDHVYISNSSRGTLHKVALLDGSPGQIELVAMTGPLDDFIFDDDGTIFATTHGDELLRIPSSGETEIFIDEGCGACTSAIVQTIDGMKRLVILTTGHLLEGGTEPAKILSVALDQ